MTGWFLLALVMVVIAAFVVIDRKDARADKERGELLTRIQHPEVVPFHLPDDDEELLSVEFDNDESFAELRRAASE